MKDCPFDVGDVRIEVLSQGSGFDVRVVAKDEQSGREVLRRAQLLI